MMDNDYKKISSLFSASTLLSAALLLLLTVLTLLPLLPLSQSPTRMAPIVQANGALG